MNTIPSSASRSANLAFSLRKPYLHICLISATYEQAGHRLTQDERPDKSSEPKRVLSTLHPERDKYNTNLCTALVAHLDDLVHTQLC